MYHIIAVPAYGRQYSNAEEVKADWEAGKDFKSKTLGSYLNKQDAKEENLRVTVHYKGPGIRGYKVVNLF